MEINGKYYLTDIESGKQYEVTKEYHDAYKLLWNCVSERLEKSILGKAVIYGTSGEIKGNDEELKKMFYGDNK